MNAYASSYDRSVNLTLCPVSDVERGILEDFITLLTEKAVTELNAIGDYDEILAICEFTADIRKALAKCDAMLTEGAAEKEAADE